MAKTKTKTAALIGAGILLIAIVASVYVFRHEIQARIDNAAGKSTLANHSAELLDLTRYYSAPASYFDKITAYPAWKVVPRGFHTFVHVPLQIDGMICLWGGGCAKMGLVFPENLTGIPVNRKFQTLYVYHTAFYVAPKRTPVYELVFNYEDGSSVTNEIQYGTQVLDWYANRGGDVIGPSGPDSRLAWHGELSQAGRTQPLRFCLTALENPQASLQVTSIDLRSSMNISSGCLLAMTTGQSGLMK